MRRILKNKEVEDIAVARLAEYENCKGKVSTPICVDRVIEHCGLSILYDSIEEKFGETILGGLIIKEKLIVINERHMRLFKKKPGLERSTKGHELGHWDIFANRSRDIENLYFDFYKDTEQVVFRNSNKGELSVILSAWQDEDVYRVYKEHIRRKDHPNVESAVNRYASCLLMPKHLINDYVSKNDLTEWKNLYRMAETFDVTISALCVRLQRLGMIYIKKGKIYKTKDEAIGQGVLF